jgi:hypothetical protein
MERRVNEAIIWLSMPSEATASVVYGRPCHGSLRSIGR